jgi:preprotein translocase subunit SecG
VRGEEKIFVPTNSPVIIPPRNRIVLADILDPKDGTVHFHIVSTKYLSVLVASLITLFLAGLIVLGLIIYLKSDIDQNKRQIEQIRQEGLVINDNTQESPTPE